MSWHPVCARDSLQAERGVAALVDGVQVAVVATFDGDVYAIGNIDPYTGAAVLSRGIVGTRGEHATIASPLHKQVFSLATGDCIDDPGTRVATYRTRIRDRQVEIFLDRDEVTP